MDFLKSIALAASGLRTQAGRMRVISENIANAESTAPNAVNTFNCISPWTRWWRDTNASTRQFSTWKRRDDHEARHHPAVPAQPHPY